MTTKSYRVINAGYTSPRTVWSLESAVRFAYEMCNAAEASSIIVDPETGKTIGGCDIDPEFGTPVSYLF